MRGLRGGVVAVAAMLLVACAVPVVPASGGGGGAPQSPPISVIEIVAEGETIEDASLVNERGQVAVRLAGPGFPSVPNSLWQRGIVTPVMEPPPPDGDPTVNLIVALSDRGQVVGGKLRRVPPGSWFPTFLPFSWSPGEFTVLPTEGRTGFAFNVNNHGQVVGVLDRSPGDDNAVMWEQGQLVRLGLPVGPTPDVESIQGVRSIIDINDRGQIALPLEVEVDGVLVSHAAVREPDGQVVDLGTLGGPSSRTVAISERGHVAGVSGTAGGTEHAFLWHRGEMIDLGTLGGDTSRAVTVNDHGHVVGVSETAEGTEHAFLWRGGEMVDLGGLPGSARSTAVDINNHDQVVGTSYPAGDDTAHAFLWQDGQVTNLGDLVAAGAPSEARDLNDRGQIVGLANWVQDGTSREGGQPVMWTARPNR